MPKFKVRINSKEAAESIRSGMSDSALMKKYALSAGGLQKLFRKLVAAGELKQPEVDIRLLTSQQSHVVDLIISQPTQTKKAVIEADQAVKDIRAGLNDIELMEKYNVSAKGLESLFMKLVATSQISARELDERKRRSKWAKSDSQSDSETALQNGEPLDEPYDRGQSVVSNILRDHRVFAAAAVGACIGMLLVAVLGFAVMGIDKLWSAHGNSGKSTAKLKAANEALLTQAQEMISILGGLERGDPGAGAASQSTRTELQKCLEDCERGYKDEDELEKALSINCKKECLSTHSERFRKIRELYH